MSEPQKGVIQRVPVTPSPIAGTFTFPANRTAPTVPIPVMVKHPHTAPARVEIVVGVSRRFRGTGGTLDESGKTAAIRLFDSATGNTAIVLPPTGLQLTAAQLNRGFHLFAESNLPSDSVGDYVLTLTLAGGPDPLATPAASVGITAVRLIIDVFPPGPAFGSGVPAPMPEPPATAPAAGTATDKWFLGRTVNVQDAALAQARGRIHVRQVEPFNFTGNLSIRQRSLTGTTLGRDSARAALMDDDNAPPSPALPPPSTVVHPNPFAFAPPSIIGRDFFVEGRALSAARRDVAFQLGLEGGEPDGDRVAFTVGVGCSIEIGNTLRAVLVKKAPANPARQVITLRTNVPFSRSGSFDVTAGNTPPKVQFFAAANNVAALALPITAPGARLSSPTGFQLFVEGIARSASVDELALSLTLTDGSPPAGLPATARMTAVELTLDVFLSRPLAGGPAPLMPTAAKVATGRFVQVASPTASHERAQLIVRPPNPNLSCDLMLRAIGPAPAPVRLFTDESPAVDREVALPERIASVATTIGPFDRFAEGVRPSALMRDTGFQLGIDTLDDDGDRVPMTALEFAVADDDTAAAPALRAVRFGLWDQAYDAASDVRPDFIDNDLRRFHFHLRGPLVAASLQINWKTLRANGADDGAPPSQALTLTAPAGGGRLVSSGVMLVTDDVDAGRTPPASAVPAAAVPRLRRALIDGFVSALAQPSPGQFHRLKIPVFDRAAPFDTTSASVVVAGVAAVVPAAMRGTASTGARWEIQVGSRLTIDTGANAEEIAVTAVTAHSFTATFANAHDGSATPFRIAGRTDERRRLEVRVVRYTNAGDATYLPADEGDIEEQFKHANLRWRQAGLQIDPFPTEDRQIPAAALDGTGKFPEDPPNSPQEIAAYTDLILDSNDGSITVVFADLSGANAFTSVQDVPDILTARGLIPFGDRMFIFMGSRLNPIGGTLAHELHHALHNRFDTPAGTIPGQFFTFNTEPSATVAGRFGVVLPNARVRRRMHTLHANPNLDPNNDSMLNWFRRPRSGKVSAANGLGPATPTTGSNSTTDF